MRMLHSATRILPWTICAMALLLVVKSITLVRAAVPAGAAPVAAIAPPARAEVPPKPGETRSPLPLSSAPPPATEVAAPRPEKDGPPITDSERALLLELRSRRGELDRREAALAGRESMLAAAEQRLRARLDELTTLQQRIEALERARQAHDEENWRGLVKLYETMKPRDAAAIFNDLDLPVLLEVVDRMKEAKAAPVLAAMQPERARLLTAELARKRAQANSVTQTGGGPGGTATNGKGKT